MKKYSNNGGVSRLDRMNSELKKEISDIIQRKLKNPLITAMCSVVEVNVSKDLSYAKVYLSIFSTDEQKKITTFNAINDEAKKIRYELAHSIKARTVPELHFVIDSSMDYGSKIDKLLLEIEKGENKEN